MKMTADLDRGNTGANTDSLSVAVRARFGGLVLLSSSAILLLRIKRQGATFENGRQSPMNGAEALVAELIAEGVDVMFANPGTTEMIIVEAMDKLPGLRPILCVHETVCTGAADGYARMTGRPAVTLLHLGVGLANGLSQLHNAARAGSPVLNLVGVMSSWHAQADPLLQTRDAEGLARSASRWVATSTSASVMAVDA